VDVFDAGPARPREGLRTRLAGAHVAHSGFVPGVAHFGRRAAFRPLGIVAIEGLEALDAVQRRGIAHPLDRLPVGHEPDVVHGDDGVEEGLEALLVVSRLKMTQSDVTSRYSFPFPRLESVLEACSPFGNGFQ